MISGWWYRLNASSYHNNKGDVDILHDLILCMMETVFVIDISYITATDVMIRYIKVLWLVISLMIIPNDNYHYYDVDDIEKIYDNDKHKIDRRQKYTCIFLPCLFFNFFYYSLTPFSFLYKRSE